MKLAALSSGGKDSLYAAYIATKAQNSLEYLLSMKPATDESYMFHHPNIELSALQAQVMDVPVRFAETAGEKEKELRDLEALIESVAEEVDGIVSGALASDYQKKRIDAICERLDLESIAPLWHFDPEEYWDMLLDDGFKVLISRVAAQGLGREWLGRVIDREAVEELKRVRDRCHIHLAFEGGEAESFVLDCPMFSRRIEVVKAKKEWLGQSGTYRILETRLEGKKGFRGREAR